MFIAHFRCIIWESPTLRSNFRLVSICIRIFAANGGGKLELISDVFQQLSLKILDFSYHPRFFPAARENWVDLIYIIGWTRWLSFKHWPAFDRFIVGSVHDATKPEESRFLSFDATFQKENTH